MTDALERVVVVGNGWNRTKSQNQIQCCIVTWKFSEFRQEDVTVKLVAARNSEN